ncbi:AraC family transcriptional regulator [Agrobacterium rhizogenes]|uniref:AraC family transcriptional regulator n=1 Tax=Rhizobium rhizogenes TaxID=359 RepID=UPI001571EFFF|nr:AraC family transcriptional regulator [Rhizobium rhizogenes]NTH16766.1 AraC family transcriptional regulator [Rhizobium rhizogenes]
MKSQIESKVPKGILRFQGRDSDGLSEALSTQASPVVVEATASQTMSFHCEFVSAGSVTFGLATYEGYFQCKRDADLFRLFIPFQGSASFTVGGKVFESRPGYGFISDGERPGEVRFAGSRQHLAVILTQNEICNRLTEILEIPVSGNLNFCPHIDLISGSGRVLQDLAAATFNGMTWNGALRQSPLALSNLTSAIVNLILETVPHRFSDELARTAPSPSPRHVKRAIDFMQANLSHPISLADIAAACHVSVRSLHKGFREFKLTTPVAYLQHLRLEAAHRDLQQAPAGLTVAAIALKWGFTHMGRFAADYKLRFGRSPSQTLRR